ncbi:MAG TPA: flagellar basal body protein [Bryobacteraceae bacterium]|nr:flagellar basal body protein [Bryobacteraceae bacterium]
MLESLSGNLEQYMTLLSARQKLVASNLANADTPGYKTQDIDFQHEFNAQLGMLPSVVEVPGLQTKNDGNNVNIDREARLLAENQLRFSIASTLTRSELQSVREAIKDGATS